MYPESVKEATGSFACGVTAKAMPAIMIPMSFSYFRAAEIAKESALNILHNREAIPKEAIDYIAFSSTSILLAVAALEANINELMVEFYHFKVRPLESKELYSFVNSTNVSCKCKELPKKLNAEEEIVKRAEDIVRDCHIEIISIIRNELTHCVPSIHEMGGKTSPYSKNIRKILTWYKNMKFNFENKFWDEKQPDFPRRIINAQFADWFFIHIKDFIVKYQKEVVDPMRK